MKAGPINTQRQPSIRTGKLQLSVRLQPSRRMASEAARGHPEIETPFCNFRNRVFIASVLLRTKVRIRY